ncbi:MFS transporter [Streptomyces sp. NBC_01363]|uniref:MFS transporter n=1 Tax=Streptomyces sp. NBC_01363 TaxID=2903840 RepID=UPI0022536AAC|nr:MFS transporter [Streptomyces sp. NBC_01363]MCX4734111.1 MFS transporter [Streptomyces sp. NBC_01363]
MNVDGASEETAVTTSQMERNLRLMPVLSALATSAAWQPVFVLFSTREFGLHNALLLSSLFFLAGVVLEIPSGWASDNLGRIGTLRIAAVSWIIAEAAFTAGSGSLPIVAIGQIALAAGFAFTSGTDVAYHFDTLEALGREEEFAERQSRVRAIGFVAKGVCALIGGALGLLDLRITFLFALVIAITQLGVSMAMYEPPRPSERVPFKTGLLNSLGYLRNAQVAWFFGYLVLLATLHHLSEALMQPWLAEVLGKTPEELGGTPLFSGAVLAVIGIIGAASAARLSRRFGSVPVLIGYAVLSALIVTAMASSISFIAVSMLALRSLNGAASDVLVSHEVSMRVGRFNRATLISCASMLGALGYSGYFTVVSGDESGNVGTYLDRFALTAWIIAGVVFLSACWVWSRSRASSVSNEVLARKDA